MVVVVVIVGLRILSRVCPEVGWGLSGEEVLLFERLIHGRLVVGGRV